MPRYCHCGWQWRYLTGMRHTWLPVACLLPVVAPALLPPGLFVGVELDEAVGKNTGTVKGVSYFACEPKKGLLIRPVRPHPSIERRSA